MSQELNATCDICGKKYHVCNSCKEIKSFTPWRTVTDTLQHYAIFLALSQYTKTKDKEKAQRLAVLCIQGILSDLESFNDNIKTVIKEIMEEPEIKVIEPTIKIENKPQKLSSKRGKVSVKQDEVTDDDIE